MIPEHKLELAAQQAAAEILVPLVLTEVESCPPGRPSWITPELIEDTLKTWQPYYGKYLTTDDALEILLTVGHLLDTLEQT